MATEQKRACGYRKVNGLYMVSGALAGPCCKLPIALDVRKRGEAQVMTPTTRDGITMGTTQSGFKHSRGWQWVDPRPYLTSIDCTGISIRLGQAVGIDLSFMCPCANPETLGERVGMMWISDSFYPTVESFNSEASEMGISRRIGAVPIGFELGQDWVFLCHPKAVRPPNFVSWFDGIFSLFKPERIEKLITESDSRNDEEMAKLARKKITPVIVPDADLDHQGTVYEDSPQEELFEHA